MTAFVVDASAAAAWVLPDEASAASEALMDLAMIDGAAAPPHFPAELAAAVLRARRRGRITDDHVVGARGTLDAVPMDIDQDGWDRIWSDALPLAVRFGIGLYDAVYLELALRSALPLATFDVALRAAAVRAGVSLAC